MKKPKVVSTSILIVFMLISLSSFSQNDMFNLQNSKAYYFKINGVNNLSNADYLERQMEKSDFAQLSFVEPTTGVAYFIVENDGKANEIKNFISNEQGYSVAEFQETPLTDALFVEVYMKRTGFTTSEISKNIPSEINLGPKKELAMSFYLKVIAAWGNLYSTSYNNSIGVASHHPIFFNTGNPERDNSKFDQEKQNWIINYPEEVEQITNRSYKDATENDNPKDIEKLKSSN